jgi:hypothetical protein
MTGINLYVSAVQTRVKRHYFTLLGLGLLTAVALLVIGFGINGPDGLSLLAIGALLFAADMFVIGGLTDGLSIDSWVVRWHHWIGCGAVLVGLANILFSAEAVITTDTALVGVVAFAGSGLVLTFIGIDIFRGGVHYDLAMLK